MDQAEQLRNAVKKHQENSGAIESKPAQARVITVTSGKGGVGKSNTSVNLAVQFRKMGKKVIIFDADLGLANVEVMFGKMPEHNLSDVVYRGMSITDVITEGPMGIGFVSGGSGIIGLNNLNADQIGFLIHNLHRLGEMADVLIIDTGAGISDSVLMFVMASPEVLLVSTPEPSSLTDSYSLMKALYKNPGFNKDRTKISVIANKVTSYAEGQLVYEKLQTVVSEFLDGNLEYLGMIPQDANLEKAVRMQKLVSVENPSSRSSRAFELIAQSLMNKDAANEPKERVGIGHMISQLLKRGIG